MTTAINSNKFNFFVPLDLEKGSDGRGGTLVKIKGIASSESEDSDGETLIPSGFDFGPLLKTGFLNWNHQATKSAKAICGEPTAAKIINGGKDFYIEGFLYPNAQGKEVAELAETLELYSPNRRLGFSIEGQAIERGCGPEFLDKSKTIRNPQFDPLLWKRVTKANVTGLAITQSPKNPNTLMSIVKGEVDKLYVDEENEVESEKEKDEKEGTTEKAMGTVEIAPTMPESVEHKKKSSVGISLNKSDIYIRIHDRYQTDVFKAKEIYNFISKVNQKLFNNMGKITDEVLQKSFDILDGLVKSEGETDTLSEQEAEQAQQEEVEAKEKAKTCESMAKGLLASGMASGDVVKAMVSAGVDLSLAETACEACITQAEALKENGGTITKETTPIAKSEEVDSITATLKTQEGESISNLIKGLENGLGEKFSAVGEILKSIVGDNLEMKEVIGKLEKSLNEAESTIEQIKETPLPSKSTRTARAIERFEKGGEEGEETYNVNSRQDVGRLTDRLFAEVELLKSRGTNDLALETAVSDLEISKSTNYNALIPRLKSMGISLVRE